MFKSLIRKPAAWSLLFALSLSAVSWTSRPAKTSFSYGVASYDAFYFYVYEQVDDDIMNIDYVCMYAPYSVCTISSYLTPDVLGRIPRMQAIVLTAGSCFLDLDPTR